MQRSNPQPLRDPFAVEEDDPNASSGSVPPPRSQASTRYTGSLGAPRSSRIGNSSTARSLGLSLGVPRNRKSTTTDAPRTEADDAAVRATDSDALQSRLSALKLGYLPAEPFSQEFSTPSPAGFPTRGGPDGAEAVERAARRSPLINIGTYLRCSTIDTEVERFLRQDGTPKQLISVGAGSDSRFWRIMSNQELATQLHHYVEIDFVENTAHKLARILRSPLLRSLFDPSSTTVHGVRLDDLPSHSDAPTEAKGRPVLHSSRYTLLSADVRALHPDAPSPGRIDAEALFGEASTGLDPRLPTLVLFECVLAYIEPQRADWLIRVLGETFNDVHALSYDIALAGHTPVSTTGQPIGPSKFGRVMLQNLEMRKLSLTGAKAYPTIEDQSSRFVRHWANEQSQVETEGRSLFSIWSALPVEEKQRLSRLEGLDEVEEIDMLLKHYCIVQARRKV